MKKNQLRGINSPLSIVATSSLFIFTGLIFSKIISYFYRIIIARYFGPEVYGLFTLSVVIFGWFMAIAFFGLNSGIFRYASFYLAKKQFNKIQHIINSSSIFIAVTSLIAMIILFIYSEFIAINVFQNGNLTIFLRLFSIGIPFSMFMQLYFSTILAYQRIKWYTFILYFLTNIVKLGSLGILILIGFGSNSVALSYISGFFVSSIVLYFIVKNTVINIYTKESIGKKERWKLNREIFSYSWPFLFAAISSSIFYWVDSFMIGYFMTVKDVGFYNIAVPIALILNFAPELFLKLFLPLIIKEYANNNILAIKRLSKQIARWIFILNLPIFILVFLFPKIFISLLFGNQYIIAENSLRILAIGMFFSSLLLASNHLLQMVKKSRIILLDIIIVTILNIVLNFILVPIYGIDGAAISTTISIISLSLLYLFQAKYYTSVTPLELRMINIVIVSIIPSFLILYLGNLFGISVTISIVLFSLFFLLYVFLILMTKNFDKDDIYIVKSVFPKISYRFGKSKSY